MTPDSDSAAKALVSKSSMVQNEPVRSASTSEIGTPIGTVIAIACSTEPVSTPRRRLALLKANVAAEQSAMRPPSTWSSSSLWPADLGDGRGAGQGHAPLSSRQRDDDDEKI